MVKVKRICGQCGKEFFEIPSIVKRGGGKFCSQECYGKARRKRIIRICKHCRKEFEVFPSEIKKGNGFFCSRECWSNWINAENNPNWKGGGIQFICRNCGKTFELAKYELKKQKGFFCTRKCDFEYRAKNRKVSDIQNRINRNMRSAVTRYIGEKKEGRRWISLVGYTLKELCEHLEEQFRDGMMWDNYGDWHIDHIIPISKFHFESFDDEGFKKAWALNNIQPLWADENMKKGGRWRWY